MATFCGSGVLWAAEPKFIRLIKKDFMNLKEWPAARDILNSAILLDNKKG